MHGKHAFCSWCGARFPPHSAWPRTCTQCRRMTYLNPLPVAVLVLPVDDGVLMIRRGEAGRGHRELALPGGFIERGESWQHACARELFEETQISIAPEKIEHFRAMSTNDGFLIVVGRAPPMREADLTPFTPTDESLERVIVREPTALAFAMHEEVLRDVLPGLSKEAKRWLRFEVDHLTVRLKSPTHRVAPRNVPLEFIEVERPPTVTTAKESAFLTFEPLHHEATEENGQHGALVTSVRRLRGVATLEQALVFFAMETGIMLTPEQVKTEQVAAGAIILIDLVEAGWAPGNTFVFVIPSAKPKQTLFFSPTHWLRFDWGSLTVE